jgi:DNA processing protein
MGPRLADATSRTRAWLTLALVPGLGPARARRLVERFGTPEAVCALSPAALAGTGVAAAIVDGWSRAKGLAASELERLARLGASLRVWDDAGYPARLRAIADPPLALAVRGALEADELAVAVVGARRASAYGRRVAEELAQGLAAAGLTVVSGLATGIDAAAHRGALAARGRTVAVLATGVDGVYPPWHAGLAREVAASGALVSEFACGTPPLPHHFPRRNRLISGLTLGTVVVEATPGSGSLITARSALEQGREVFAVPGPVGVALHDGTHQLIRSGATLVRNAEDVIDEIAPALRARLAAARASATAATLSDVETRVMDVVRAGGAHVDDVIRHTALEPGAALETLLALELRGLLEQHPGMRFLARAA